MSVFEGSVRSSRLSSILKTPNLKNSVSKTPSKVRFALPEAKKVRRILEDFLQKENVRNYENLVVSIRDAELSDDDVCILISEANHCISLLTQELRLFVEAVLTLRWTHRSVAVTKEYKSFIVNLISAHNYHARYAIDKLVANFIPNVDDEWENGEPSKEDEKLCSHIHWILKKLIKVVPMSQTIILNSLKNTFPYVKKSTHVHEYYLHNLFVFLTYQPQCRRDIISLILSKLIVIDVTVPKEDILRTEEGLDALDENPSVYKMDVFDSDSDKLKHPLGHTLDICMDKVLTYIIMECYDDEEKLDWGKIKGLYRDLISIFDCIILPTYNIHHVQFVMFILCCLKATISEAFLNYLWKKVCTPSIAPVIRQSAVCYIASFIARSRYIEGSQSVPLSILKGTLQQMAAWVHSYISTQDEVDYVNFDVKIHSVFYTVCQSIFYVISFRQRDLCHGKKNITFLESLNLTKIVTCRLNPLRVCQPAIVQNFAAITRKYQLVYCYSIIEHNSRNVLQTIYRNEKGSTLMSDDTLETFYPFDPYVLKRSGQKIWAFYVDYKDGTVEKVDRSGAQQEMEVDDFLCEQSNSKYDRFSYSSSPGFR